MNDFGTKILKIFIAFGTSVIVARSLGPERLGYAKYLLLFITTFAQFGSIGLIDATSYFQRKSKYDIKTIFNVNLSFLILLSLIYLITLCWLKYAGLIFSDYSIEIVIFSSVTLIFFGFLNDLLVATLISKENIYSINNSLLYTSIINLILLGALWLYDLLGVTVYLLIFPLSNIVRTLIMLKKIDIKFKFNFDLNTLSDELKYGFIVFLGAFFIFLNYRIDQWLIKYYLGNKELGLYTVGVTLAEIILIITTSVINPLRARLYNIDTDSEKFKTITAKTVKFTVYATAIISIPLFFAVNLLSSEYLYGQKYSSSIAVVKILLFGLVFISFGKIGSHYYVIKGRPYIHLFSSLFIFLLNLTLNIILIPDLGIKGAAISSTISYIVYGFLYVYLYIFVEHFKVGDLFIIGKNDILALTANYKNVKSKIWK